MPILLQEDLERPLPPMYWVRQQFNDEVLTDVVGAVKEQLARPEVAGLVKPGARLRATAAARRRASGRCSPAMASPRRSWASPWSPRWTPCCWAMRPTDGPSGLTGRPTRPI